MEHLGFSGATGRKGSLTVCQALFYFICYFWLCWVFVAARGLSLVAARGLLVVVSSPVAEHGLSARGLQ